VVQRLGDVFGRTVNLASRLTGLAQPGTVLCDSATAAALAGVPGLELDRERVRAVRGWGLVEPVVLRRSARDGG
jgi:adenylate cyclase